MQILHSNTDIIGVPQTDLDYNAIIAPGNNWTLQEAGLKCKY